jgi:hypothetical protein
VGGGGGVWAIGRFAPDSPKKQLKARVALRARGRLTARGRTVCPAEQDGPPEGDRRRRGVGRRGGFLSCCASGGMKEASCTRSGFAASHAGKWGSVAGVGVSHVLHQGRSPQQQHPAAGDGVEPARLEWVGAGERHRPAESSRRLCRGLQATEALEEIGTGRQVRLRLPPPVAPLLTALRVSSQCGASVGCRDVLLRKTSTLMVGRRHLTEKLLRGRPRGALFRWGRYPKRPVTAPRASPGTTDGKWG